LIPRYSIVVPFHNQQETVTASYDRLKGVMEEVGEPFEMVFVDDGSGDGTFRMLEEIAAVDSRVAVVKLRRNFGPAAALAAGFDTARGDYVVAMDAEWENDPGDIPRLLEKLAEGYDIVSGSRRRRFEDFRLRRLPAYVAEWVLARLSGVRIRDFGASFRAYRRELVHQAPLYGEMHRFLPAVASWQGAAIAEVPLRSAKRDTTTSPPSVRQALRLLFDLVTLRFLLSYLARPLLSFGAFGMLGIFAGGGTALWLAYRKFVAGAALTPEHAPLMILAAVLILAGVQLLALGVLGEMQMRHLHEPAHRSHYTVDRVLPAKQSEQSPIADS
jgi:glycosyltransferase involved in cell wall biosynthesis